MSDFDDVLYLVMVSPEETNQITLNVALRNWADLSRDGAKQVLAANFPSCEISPESGFDVAIKINADSLPSGPWGSGGEACAKQLAEIKVLLMGAPLAVALKTFGEGGSPNSDVKKVSIKRPTGCGGGDMFITAKTDSVVVIFSVDFADETDKAVCKVFLQEFVESQRSVTGAPSCAYKRGSEPPSELSSFPNIDGTPDIAGFMSFKLFKDHVKTQEKRDRAVSTLIGFLNYLQYHIKAVTGAPSCAYKRGSEPPSELSSFPNIDGTPDIAGFMSFKLFKDHVKTQEKRDRAVSTLIGFLNYLQYHIKASKTYMHMRMRHKVNDLLQVLNRANQTTDEKKEKKTMSGKTFTRA